MASFTPAYVEAYERGVLRDKVERGLAALRACRLCPRDCGVDRLADRDAVCLTGRFALVSTAHPHFGEEDCLRGWRGSGTVFFGRCNLKCVFCQNFDISQRAPRRAAGMRPAELAARMLDLQRQGCHNLNLVTPEHVVPQVLEALLLAVERGLRLPLVYNTSAYDSAESLALLDGVVDIYMPDLKVLDPTLAQRWLKAANYPDAARHAVREMQRQVGDLVFDRAGLAVRGLLVRHLVMPGALEQTRAVMRFLVRDVSANVYVNVMDQYGPAGKVGGARYPELDRAPSRAELREAVAIAVEEGVRRLDRRRPHPRLMAGHGT